jgi:hypothetical protein
VYTEIRMSGTRFRTPREDAMDLFAVPFLVTPAAVVGGVLCIGLTAVLQARRRRRERLQMKRHVQRIDLAGWNEYPRGIDACDRLPVSPTFRV